MKELILADFFYKFDFLDLVKYNFFDLAKFTIINRFLIFLAIILS